MDKLKALVVDDSVLYRKILTDILSTIPDIEVAGTAHNGKAAIEKVRQLKPDFITLDFEMPELDGIETLKKLKEISPETMTVMVSAHTKTGAAITMRALEEGAFDFIAKPETRNIQDSKELLLKQLNPIINVISTRLKLGNAVMPLARRIEKSAMATSAATNPRVTEEIISSSNDIKKRMKAIISPGANRIDIVAIGISTGGPNALSKMLPMLPADFKVPIVIVQHMPPVFTNALAESLTKKSKLRAVEGAEGMLLEAGKVYIAPGGKQMKLEKDESRQIRISITDAPPENNCRPSADYLFRSVAKCYGNNALGVIMTGMGSDGTKGLIIMKKLGAKVIAQDERSCIVFGMPMEAIKAGVADIIAPLENIAGEILDAVNAR
ncbi:MAG: hypothetical protein A2020_14415 [Lentisphaerae bacterium GWF2_45_14]|nr:MAG: hypothetical protein A2020_14415 [Lentisphaerae bacterium GWF2_45_14]